MGAFIYSIEWLSPLLAAAPFIMIAAMIISTWMLMLAIEL